MATARLSAAFTARAQKRALEAERDRLRIQAEGIKAKQVVVRAKLKAARPRRS